MKRHLRGVPVAAVLVAMCATAAGAQQLADSIPAAPPDTSPADSIMLLAPLVVNAERELAAPPPVATVVVEPEVIQRAQAENPYDLIREVADVEVHEQGQGPGFASDAVIRGFTSDHSADVLLVIDGVPVNLPIHGHGEGYADWNVLLAPAISSLRVIHGTASPLYGNFALGGVVEVFTAAEAEQTTVSLHGTSDADAGGWLRTGHAGYDGGWMGAAALRRNDGWRDNSDYWLTNGLLRGWRALGDGRLEGGLALYGSDWSSPGFVSVARFNDEQVEDAADATDGGSARRGTLRGRWSTPLDAPGASLELTAWGLASDWELFLNIPGSDSILHQTGERDERVAAGGELALTLDRPFGELTAGLELRHDRAAFTLNDTEARGLVARVERIDASYLVTAGFARWRRVFGGRFALDLGGRVDVFRYRTNDRLAGSGWQGATSAVASPKLGARWRAGDHVALFASTSRGFRGAVGVLGDPDRPPILAWAHEAGVSYERGPLHAQAALFRLDVDNERAQDPVTRVITSAGESTRQGVDLDLELRLADGVSLFGSGTFNDARLSRPYADAHDEHGEAAGQAEVHAEAEVGAAADARTYAERLRFGPARSAMEPLHDEPDAGEWVPGVARYTARLGMRALLPASIEARASLRVTGPYVPIGEAEFRTQPYSVLDIGATVPFADRVELDLELENALGIRYAELRASGYLNPGRPRLLRAALRMNAPGF